ncbi:hypothetical protein HDU83_008940 [Entophlyctis luteolus]|nr:hypothetical protein HDU83_008940 [Entophlyctis luteolus]
MTHACDDDGAARDELSLRARGLAAIDAGLLARMHTLVSLDLSCNCISDMRPVALAVNLVHLDLAGNEISSVDGLQPLRNLHRLILSYNKIRVLKGLADITSTKFYHLDLKGNLIEDFSQLHYLAGLTLKSLVLNGTDESLSLVNPICKIPVYRDQVLEILPWLESLDSPVLTYFPDIVSEFNFDDPTLTLESSHEMHAMREPKSTEAPKVRVADPTATARGECSNMIYYFQAMMDKLEKTGSTIAANRGQSEVNATKDTGWYQDRIEKLENQIEKLTATLEGMTKEQNPSRETVHDKITVGAEETESDSADERWDVDSGVWLFQPEYQGYQSKPSVKANKQLVWASAPSKESSPEQKPPVADVIPQESPNKEIEKLIQALETERDTLSKKELEYRAEIFSLNEKAVAVLKSYAEEKAQVSALEQKVKSLEDSDKLKSDLFKNELTELQRQLHEKELELGPLRCANDRLLVENETSKSALEKMKARIEEVTEAVNASNDHKTSLARKMLKSRESYRSKLSQLTNEIEENRSTIKKLQECNEELADRHSQAESEWKAQVEKLNRSHQQELSNAVKKATETLSEAHEKEIENLARMLTRSKKTMDDLDREFRERMSSEHEKYSELCRSVQDLLRERNELLKVGIPVVVKATREAKSSEEDLRAVTKELTNVVKEQKIRISDQAKKHDALFAMFEEKCHLLENEINSLNLAKANLDVAYKELSACKSELSQKTEMLAMMQSETRKLEMAIQENKSEYTKQRELLSKKCEDLERDILQQKSERENAEQALRIKNKMLDDQIDTIKNLKQNLENKSREHATLLQDVGAKESRLDETLSRERSRVRELSRELATNEEALEQLQMALQECRDERDTLHSELMEVTKKLQDRNYSIARIEEEVGKAKSIFAAKEARLTQEIKDLTRSKEAAIDDVKRYYENQSQRARAFELERESLFEATKKLKSQLSEAEANLVRKSEELKKVEIELEKQKLKFMKLKEALEL